MEAVVTLDLPRIGFGCWQLGSKGEDDYWGLEFTQDLANELVASSCQHGITYFDTAEDYAKGQSEIQLGEALRQLTPGDRKPVLIGSKILPNNCLDVRKHTEGTLTRLGVEYIDIYMVHWPLSKSAMAHFASNQTTAAGGRDYSASDPNAVTDVPAIETCFKDLMKMQAEGKIKHIGVSNFGVKQLSEVLALGVTVAVNQLCYNLVFRAVEFEVMPFCLKNNIQVLAYSPLMQGLLTGKWKSAEEVPVYRARSRHFDSAKNPKSRHGEAGQEDLLFETLSRIEGISVKTGIPMVTLATSWVLHRPGVSCVIAGATSLKQVESNAAAASILLPEDVVQELCEATDDLKQAMGKNCDLWQGGTDSRIE
ncbi:hypothetical protein CYMTET_45935 [Cymbomonas tetramitiformis]|uniref:NADP-dependent oxidoreductase domain-containing protein n=1 Tax=Cymbomonas tetramitiformis TaxID=36881 RepID=A0AAE0EZ70_9CHLO|nr:hypothetical protein CYMTET_45935 [Cymbomonas tetramitiformis]|eukprot:gene23052-27897_t